MGNCLLKPNKNSNHSKLCHLVVDIGTRALRDLFDSLHPPDSLHVTLKDPNNQEIFERLHSEGDLSSLRWSVLCGTSTDETSSQNFDIVLLCFLLRYFSNLKPQTGWYKDPLYSDLSKEADFVRILLFRNSISDYALCITDDDFAKYWNDLKAVLVRLGGKSYANEIDKLRKKHIEVHVEKRLTEMVISWKNDEDNLVMGMREIENEMTHSKERENSKDEDSAVIDESQLISDPETYKQNLKSSIQNKTTNLPNYNAHILEEMKMEDVFTCLKITDTKSTENEEQLPSTVVIKKCAEIFISDNGKNPNRLALVAGSGVGKSLFSLKLLRIFVRDELFAGVSNPPNLVFALFLTFRELNLVDIDINLKELLNLSSTLDNNSKIGSAMLNYFLQHPEQVFILMDGIDEFMYFDKLGSDYEEKFSNDAYAKMPVGVLCDKLLRGKLLSDSVIMITSRPDEAWDVMKRVHFDRYLEIAATSTSKNISGPFRYRLW